MDFSVVIPVRGNLKGLVLTLGAFELFTHKRDQLEVILICDDNDPEHGKYIELTREYTFRTIVKAVPRSDNFCRDYYNYGASLSHGKNILVFNDDCYMQTDGWDDIVRKAVEGKSIYLVDMLDSTHDHGGCPFPRFPLISRKAMDTIGFFFYPQVRMWPADRIIWELYSNAGATIRCHEVKMQHDHVYEMDESKSRMWRIYQEDLASGAMPVKIGREIDKLKGAMSVPDISEA